jgi:predicted DCC family thiol-disulfide oxidoreductase YuxK
VSPAPVGRYVALYDGDCGFCTRWRDRMVARDPGGVVEWLSVHEPAVAARFPGLDREDALRQMYVVAPDGSLHKGAEGWRELFRVLDGLSWVAALYRIPGVPFVMDRAYRFIAARRERLSCSGAACRRPGGQGAGGRAGGAGGRPGGGGSRAASVLVPLLGILGASVLSGCGEAEPDPVRTRLEAIADPDGGTVVAAMLEAYGPYQTWRTHHNVEYTYRLRLHGGGEDVQVESLQMHRLDLGPGARSFVQDLQGDAPQIVRVAGDRLDVSRAGVPVTDPAQLEFPRAFVRIARWSFLLPWSLLDPDSSLEYRGERTPPTASRVPSDACDVVRLTFDPKDAARRNDWNDFYISRVNHLIDRVHSYRAEDKTYRVVLWSDHRTSGGVRVATRRETHTSDVSGEIGPIEAVVEYSDVRFDAPFGDEIWSGMPEAAPTPEPLLPTAAGRLEAPALER